jgi:hypothetical protein
VLHLQLVSFSSLTREYKKEDLRVTSPLGTEFKSPQSTRTLLSLIPRPQKFRDPEELSLGMKHGKKKVGFAGYVTTLVGV